MATTSLTSYRSHCGKWAIAGNMAPMEWRPSLQPESEFPTSFKGLYTKHLVSRVLLQGGTGTFKTDLVEGGRLLGT